MSVTLCYFGGVANPTQWPVENYMRDHQKVFHQCGLILSYAITYPSDHSQNQRQRVQALMENKRFTRENYPVQRKRA